MPFAFAGAEAFALKDAWVQRYRQQTEAMLKEHFQAYEVLCYDFKVGLLYIQGFSELAPTPQFRTTAPLGRTEADLNDPLRREALPVGAHGMKEPWSMLVSV